MDKFQRMARSLPSLYKAESNMMIRALLKSWGLSDDQITLQIEETKNQIFVDKAENKYLDFLGNNVGVPREPSLGIDDKDYRTLIPVMSYKPKQIRNTIIDLLDVFWGPVFTRANINTNNSETFNVGTASVLTGTATFRVDSKVVTGDGTNFTAEVIPGQYIKASTADGTFYTKVSEIVDDETIVLSTEYEGPFSIGVSVSKAAVETIIYKMDKGEESTIRLKPNAFSILSAATIQELIDFINSEVEHNNKITADRYLDPILGDRLNIRTNTPGIAGAIQIVGGTAVDPLKIDFDNLLHTETRAGVFEINPNEVVIRIPSSVPVLRRSLKGSSHSKDIKAKNLSKAAPFGMSSLGVSSTLTINIDGTPFVVNFDHSKFKNAAVVTADEIAKQFNEQISSLEARTGCGEARGLIILQTTNGAMDYQITGGNANTLLLFDTDLKEDEDIIQAGFPSSYIFDPKGQLFTVTAVKTELDEVIDSGDSKTFLQLVDAGDLPNESNNFLVNFGRNNQEGPIRYNSRPNSSTILIDASHVFQSKHLSGSTINVIDSNPTIPRVTGDDYPVFVTGTEEAREGAESLIRDLIASGVIIRFEIVFPEYLFSCVCGTNCGDDELDSPDRVGTLSGSGPLVF